MSPSTFILFCLGSIICLTPLAIFLVWLAALNRKNRPTIVSAAWEFTALVVGLSGFLFCTGVMLGSIISDTGLFAHGPFARLAAWMPKANLAHMIALVVFVLLITRFTRRGLAERAHSMSVSNVDEPVLAGAIDELLTHLGRGATRSGNIWTEMGAPLLEISSFAVFRHATVKLLSTDVVIRETLEKELRTAVPLLPPSADNPAAPWLTGAVTCCLVAVGCSVALIVAIPFLR